MEKRKELVKGWVKVLPFYLFTLLLLLASCKEENDTIEEFPNWQSTNDAFFSNLVDETKAAIADGDKSKELFPCFTLPDNNYSCDYSDYIVVEKLESGIGTTSPMFTDTVEVHYVGKLLPSANKYKDGYEFDRTYNGVYNPLTATPIQLPVNGVVKGFATVLMKMHRNDHWRVYIPYQLGYGTSASGSVPAYSTLMFDLRLGDFWWKEQGDRE